MPFPPLFLSLLLGCSSGKLCVGCLQHFQHLVILLSRAHCRPDTVCAVQLVPAEAHHAAVLRHVLVDGLGVVDLEQHEVGVRGVHLVHGGHGLERSHDPRALGDKGGHVGLQYRGVAQRLQGHLLRELVDVVRVLAVVHEPDDLRVADGHAQADASQPEGLAERLQHHQPRELVQVLAGAAHFLGHKVHVRLVHHHQAPVAPLEDLPHDLDGDGLGGGVARRAEEQQLGVRRDARQDLGHAGVERGGERHLDDGDVVHLGAHLVHAVGGRRGEDPVRARPAEDAHQQVDGLIAAHAQEDLLRPHAADAPDELLHLAHVRVRVPVERQVVRRRDAGADAVLVRVQEDALVVVVARAAVGLQREDVWPGQFLKVKLVFLPSQNPVCAICLLHFGLLGWLLHFSFGSTSRTNKQKQAKQISR
mmetsp:Transcript_7734/g.11665  ORF Transcript_7734/g.11665 Transcript_7734/m.11665 type:complete len:419 (-) Transcript_7734:12-1268(-)